MENAQMSAANHFFAAPTQARASLRDEVSLSLVVRMITRLIAAALVIAAVGLWVAPGAGNLPELVMMKLCASFFFALTGVHLFFAARKV